MTTLASDDFTGIGTADVSGRSLNNGLGGTGSRTWTNQSGGVSLAGDNADKVISGNAVAANIVEVTGAKKARVRVNPNGGLNNMIMYATSDSDANADGVALLLVGQTSLRACSFAAGSRTDHATTVITAPGTTFWMEIEIVADTLNCRVLNNDLSVRNTASHTFGTIPNGGDFWGFGFFLDGTDAIFDDFIVEDGAAGSQTLTPPLLTNTPIIYAPTVTGGAAPQTLTPPLLTNTPTLYAPSVAVVGFKASYILANTGPVGANPAGSMYEVAGLVDPDDYMTYTTVSGPTPGGGTLVEYPDGTFEYTGGAPAIWVIQIKINGVDYFETTTIFLYDQEFTLLPPLLVNTPTIYAPTVSVNGTVVLLPPLLTNTPVIYSPTITGGIPAPSPTEGAPNNGEAMRSCMRPAMYPAMNQG